MSYLNNHGGARPGAGRPALGRTRRVYYLTDIEEKQVRSYVHLIRKKSEANGEGHKKESKAFDSI